MILVGKGNLAQFYIKPNLDEGVSNINPDGSFDIQAFTDDGTAKDADLTATMFSLFLVPKSFSVSRLLDASDYEAVKDGSLVSLENQAVMPDKF
jgi:hypothetical protein